jgi:hypothetical protein
MGAEAKQKVNRVVAEGRARSRSGGGQAKDNNNEARSNTQQLGGA